MLWASVASIALADVTELPRVAMRADEASPLYLKSTGAPFHPRGFNHVVLEHGATGWHALFNEGVYDSDDAEATLAAMASPRYLAAKSPSSSSQVSSP